MAGSRWVVVAACVGACGDNIDATGPRPLVADPAVMVGCSPGALPAGGTRAKVVACEQELIGSRLATGRVGDFLIENAYLRAIVRGPGEGMYQHGSSGGGLVDVATVGGEDLVKEIQPAVELAVGAFDELVITEAGDDGAAEIVVRGPATSLEIITAALNREAPPVIIEHHYRLAANAKAIELETRAFAQPGAEESDYTLFEAMFVGGRARAFLPGKGWASGQGAAEMIATAGTTSSYGYVYPTDTPNPTLIDLGGIRLVQGPSLTAAGQRRWLVVGDGSVASVTEEGWRLRGVELGQLRGGAAPGSLVMIRDTDGNDVTVARGDAFGVYQTQLPAGSYVVQAELAGHAAGAMTSVVVAPGSMMFADAPAGPAGELVISVVDDNNTVATALPARVVIEQAGYPRRIEYTSYTGHLRVAVPPGTCRVSVSRGLEYEAFVAGAISITDGQLVQLDVTLAHVVDTPGWISLDTHLHSELSTDSTFPVDDRLRAVAAEGIEVPVSADHDYITDYAPIIAELGLGAWLASLNGDEVSSIVWGHTIGFPLVVDPSRTARGGPHWLHRSPSEVFAQLRAAGAAVVQVNHPRRSSNDLFDAIDFDPATLMAERNPSELGLPGDTDLSALDVDAIEVANVVSSESFEDVFADYLAMVAAGHKAAATGSTDSHGASAYAGEARTYVYVGAGDAPSSVSADAITDAIRARHVVVATGAFVTAEIGGSGPGDTANVASGAPVALHVRVQAPPWQALKTIRVYAKTQQVASVNLDENDTLPERYNGDIMLPAPASDTFYVVRVDLAGAGDPVIDTDMPSFTNPIFVHVQ